MDILTHILSGVAIGTVVSSFVTSGFTSRLKVVLISGFAAALPDLDAISLWSGFDSTIGDLFNLPVSGADIYWAKYWYSHHAFLHSAFSAVLIASFLGLIIYMSDKVRGVGFCRSVYKNRLLLIAFVLGFFIHLIEDMPTPASTWGGVNLLWPSESYVGGTGDIWWWNNYDVFLIVICVIIINLILPLLRRFVRFDLRLFTIAVFVLGAVSATVQIKTRDFDFSYTGHTSRYQEFEDKSKQIQQEILGDRLYQMMEAFDDKLEIYF